MKGTISRLRGTCKIYAIPTQVVNRRQIDVDNMYASFKQDLGGEAGREVGKRRATLSKI